MRSTNSAATVLVAGAMIMMPRAPISAQVRGEAPPAVAAPVPTDLKPLLAPHRSEMRLVSVRYAADRSLLAQNYAGRGGGGGRGGAAPDTTAGPPITVSPARIARLKRFGMSWQQALDRIDAGRLTPPAKAELDSLRGAVGRDLAALDGEANALGEVLPLLPFVSDLLNLIEARIKLRDVQSEDAARALTRVSAAVAAVTKQLRAMDSTGLNPTPLQQRRAAGAVETLRANLESWFNFYNGYDPLFTWWVAMPYRKVDSALVAYTKTLGAIPACSDNCPPRRPLQPVVMQVGPAPAPFFNEVPDLNEILALPQDEMADIVSRFRGAGGRGGGGGRGAAAPVRDAKFFQDWLAALNTLDFDQLSRNAQVDYLYLKKSAELGLSRIDKPLAANPPRKADNSGIPGAARGRDGLIRDLEDELIPYTPEQLIVLAEKEFKLLEAEMLKASRAMGFGDNWKAALEKTKTMHVPPGGQPAMIRDLIFEAIDYLRAKDLVTVPEVDAESQRMSMMSAEAQLVSPFFLGGSLIQVSFPTNEMEFDARQQSMRGNNRPWSHATAFHEMIPGHNLVGYMGQRYNGYRANIGNGSPFYGEGWAVYWEITLYDKGFHDTPEEKVGALFWRMHRCARIIFSLRFHMGQWSPQEAIDFLVDRVGHERDNATAEVRRSFQGGYGPLYQAGYLLGALQLRGLRRELVDTKIMPEKAFHDEILRQGSMPIALLKLSLSKGKLTRDTPIDWKFYGDLPSQ